MSFTPTVFVMTRSAAQTADLVFVQLSEKRMIVRGAPGLPGWMFCDLTAARDLWREALKTGARRLVGSTDGALAMAEGIAWVERIERDEDARERRKGSYSYDPDEDDEARSAF